MGRWEPGAQGRLVEAAMALFAERGYAGTTVEDIAARAGLTERTFFRYFADKREVLFGGAADLPALLAAAVTGAPPEASPMQAVLAALDAFAAAVETRREFARQRAAIVAAHDELRERELIKLATLAEAVAGALRGRGVPDPAASLAAETGMAVFSIGFRRWLDDPGDVPLSAQMRATLHELRAVVS